MFCKIYKWRIEKELDDCGQVRKSGTLRHLEKCSKCQSWLKSLKEIEQQLKAAPTDISDSLIQQFQQAVQRRLSDAAEANVPRSRYKAYKSYRIRYVMSAAAVILIAIGLFSLYYWSTSDKADYPEKIEFVTQLSDRLENQATSSANLPEQILEFEMLNMKADIRHAMGFVKNCLPQRRATSNFSLEQID